ncbi:hypothetical protein [Nocardia sp. NPDC057440]|uniref:hypothetical protein n=1 Tax=Nocardia sp. NPDC057440 TaxID=3346134 RepID=UPI00366C9184
MDRLRSLVASDTLPERQGAHDTFDAAGYGRALASSALRRLQDQATAGRGRPDHLARV